MADYKEIKGFNVQTFSSDPTTIKGQLFYNSSQASLKGVIGSGAWASGGNINTAKATIGVGATQNAAIIIAGNKSPGYVLVKETEEYNGSTWTEVGDLSEEVTYNAAAGTSTSAVSFGGQQPSQTGQTEEWNGTSWTTSPGSMTLSRIYRFGFGTLTAAVAAGGSPPQTPATEEYDGSTWSTSPGTLGTGRYNGGSTGTLTAGLVFGGIDPSSPNALVEEYDGLSWTSATVLLSARHAVKGFGIQTATTTIGQGIPYGAVSYQYDGSAWSTNASIATARSMQGGTAGTAATGLGAGGYGPAWFNNTEEFTGTATAEVVSSST